MLDYIIYGVVDNGIMILGAMTGYELERYLPEKYQKGLGAVVGAGLGNTTSDFLGGMSTLNLELATGTAAGCIIGLLFIPIIIYSKRFYFFLKLRMNNNSYFGEEF